MKETSRETLPKKGKTLKMYKVWQKLASACTKKPGGPITTPEVHFSNVCREVESSR